MGDPPGQDARSRLAGRALSCWCWLGLWIVGLLAGAVHPLGFLAALVGLGAMTWFFAALGTYVSLWSPDRKQATGRDHAARDVLHERVRPAVLTRRVRQRPDGGRLDVASSSWASLLSYEDIAAATHSGAFPQLAAVHINTGEGAWRVLATVLVGITAHLVGAALLTRAACRGFDAAAGRPKRSATGTGSGPSASVHW